MRWNLFIVFWNLLLFLNQFIEGSTTQLTAPIVINTWNFTDANARAWQELRSKHSALDAIEFGCGQCEIDRCDGTVGWGGSPSENGETTLDAMIMDGENYNVGGVGGLRRIKNAIGVARQVLDRTNHSLLVGEMATQFAIQMGFKEESLTSDESIMIHQLWLANSCQPNYWTNVEPDPREHCGPYKPLPPGSASARPPAVLLHNRESHHWNSLPTYTYTIITTIGKEQGNGITEKLDKTNHDTIGMVAIDDQGRIAAGTSTNGLRNKILGRVGDSPIPGAGCYAAKEAGAASATGDGDMMMRFLLSYQAVENLRQGMSAQQSADDVIRRIMLRTRSPYPEAAVVVLALDGSYGTACTGFKTFPHVVSDSKKQVQTYVTKCHD